MRGRVEVDQGVHRPQLGQLVEEEERERHRGIEPMGRLGAPVRHRALVQDTLRRQVALPALTGGRPEALADSDCAPHAVLVEAVAPVGPAVGGPRR